MHQNIKLPINIDDRDLPFFNCLEWDYATPAVNVQLFGFVFLNGASTDLFLRPLQNIAPWKDFYKNFKKTFFLGKIIDAFKKRKVLVNLKSVYYCCTNEFSDNFFHWFTEVIPKMIYVNNTFRSDVKFYIPFPLKEYQFASLQYCGLKFCVAKSDVTFFYKFNIVENLYKYPGYYHPGLMRQTADLVKRPFKKNNVQKRHVYVTRKSALRRRVLNEEAVLEVLKRFGFEIYDFDEISFQQQVEIVSNTAILVSVHGAALTNMIFMDPGSTIVEFLPKKIINDKCYFILAGTMKLNYYYLSSDMDGTSHVTSNFLVDEIAFEKVLYKAVENGKKRLLDERPD